MTALLQKINKDWNENFLLYASCAIIVSTCLGGISVMSIFQHGSGALQMVQLHLIVMVCMAVLASILTVQKPKFVLYAISASITICSIIMLINFLY
jgi:formate hydrogenlyase subunit 4